MIWSEKVQFIRYVRAHVRMPWEYWPMKDVETCDKPRGAGKQALIRGFPNGVTQPCLSRLAVLRTEFSMTNFQFPLNFQLFNVLKLNY